MVDTIKFSEFTNGGDLEPNQTTVGLEAGTNTRFNNPFPLLPPGSTADRPAIAANMYYRLRFNTTIESYEYYSPIAMDWIQLEDSGDLVDAPFVIYKADATLPASFNLATLGDGILKQTVTAGIATPELADNGVDYYGPGFSGYFQQPIGVKDVNGNIVVQFTTAGALSVNYLDIQSGLTGATANLVAEGGDTDVGITIRTKGIAPIGFQTAATSNQYTFYSGSGFQHATSFSFPSTAVARTVTWPDASGTVAFTSGASGIVNPGLINQLGYYAAAGTTISGLAIVNNAGLLTDNTGLPGWVAYTGTGAPVLGTSPTITTPTIQTILGGLSNIVITFGDNVNSINYLQLNNSATGVPVTMEPIGGDTNIAMSYFTKGNGAHTFFTTASSGAFAFGTGTAYQHVTNFTFANTSATRTVTWPDADGTVAFTSGASGIVNPGLINQLGYYAAGGSTISGLTGANQAALTTDGSGVLTWVPMIAGQILIGTTSGAPVAAAINSGTNITVANGSGTITVNLSGVISPTLGGTGVNNGVNTLTLAGTLATSGAFASTFTMTGATNVTFPTTGTLATTATASGIVNAGSINQLAWYAANGSTVSGLATANNGVLVTSAGGVPSISSTLPASLAIPTPNISTSINDVNGNKIIGLMPAASAVNYLNIYNNATGTGIYLIAAGSDTNVNMLLSTQAAGVFTLQTTATVNQMTINTGSGYQHTTNWQFPTTAANQTLTVPDLTGTLALSGASQAVTFASVNFGGSTLSNYVQGTFTPVLTSTGGGTCTYTIQQGSYTRVGNRVHMNIWILLASGSLNPGSLTITGLPIASAQSCAFGVFAQSLAAGATTSIMAVTNSSTTITLSQYAAGTAGDLPVSNLTGTSQFIISGTYIV
tara:strand:+ start:20087 stop:22735 length:2649 start_codon:yes stop_codon:yes gene_type:complete